MILEAVFILIAVSLWFFEFVPAHIVGLGIFIFAPVFGLLSWGETQNLISNTILLLFLGIFVYANALSRNKVLHVILPWFLKGASLTSERVILTLSLFCFFVSSFISNTAVVGFILPFASELCKVSGSENFNKRLLFTLSFFSTLGGLLTPFGTPPNGITISNLEKAGFHIGFIEWSSMLLPFSFFVASVVYFFLWFKFPCRVDLSDKFKTHVHGSLNRDQKVLILLLFTCVLIWIINDFFEVGVPIWVPIWLTCLVGFVYKAEGDRLVSVEDIRGIPWEVILIFLGGICLGEVILKSNLLNFLIESEYLNYVPTWLIVSLTVLLSGFASNTASASLLTPIFSMVSPEKTFLVGISSSFGFILPISTPTNALIYSTGHIPLRDMIRTGLTVDITGIITILAFKPILFYPLNLTQ